MWAPKYIQPFTGSNWLTQFLSRSTTMNTITKIPKKNLFFTIMLGASVIQNVLSGRKTFLPWICKRCLFISKSITGQNPHLRWSCGFCQRRSAGTAHGLTAKQSLGQWWTGRTFTLLLNFVTKIYTLFGWHVGILNVGGFPNIDGLSVLIDVNFMVWFQGALCGSQDRDIFWHLQTGGKHLQEYFVENRGARRSLGILQILESMGNKDMYWYLVAKWSY